MLKKNKSLKGGNNNMPKNDSPNQPPSKGSTKTNKQNPTSSNVSTQTNNQSKPPTTSNSSAQTIANKKSNKKQPSESNNENNDEQNYMDDNKCMKPKNLYDFFLATQLSRCAFEPPTLFALSLQYTILNKKVCRPPIANNKIKESQIDKVSKSFNEDIPALEEQYFNTNSTFSFEKINSKLDFNKEVQQLYENFEIYSIISSDKLNCYILGLKKEKKIYVIFHGPEKYASTFNNARVKGERFCEKNEAEVNVNFYKILKPIFLQIIYCIEKISQDIGKGDQCETLICGYSVGAAIATLFGYLISGIRDAGCDKKIGELKKFINIPYILSFGSPRLFNEKQVEDFSLFLGGKLFNFYRIVTKGDTVTNIPTNLLHPFSPSCNCQSCLSSSGMITGFFKKGIQFFSKKKKKEDYKILYDDCELQCIEDKKTVNINPIAHHYYYKISFNNVKSDINSKIGKNNAAMVINITYNGKVFELKNKIYAFESFNDQSYEDFIKEINSGLTKNYSLPNRLTRTLNNVNNKQGSLLDKAYSCSCREVKNIKKRIRKQEIEYMKKEQNRLLEKSKEYSKITLDKEAKKSFPRKFKNFAYQQLNWY